jgi:outer membrane protein W
VAHVKGRITLAGVVSLLMAAVRAEPARAQASPASQDLQVFVGEMFRDRFTGTPLSGSRPWLDDNASFGARYSFYFNDRWGIELSGGDSPSRAGHVPSGVSNLAHAAVDLDLEWDVVPGVELAGHPFVPYTVVGMAAWTRLDRALNGLTFGRPVTTSDSNGYTANVGLGARYYLRANVFFDFDTRYRYLSKLVSGFGQGLNTAETTLSLDYRF